MTRAAFFVLVLHAGSALAGPPLLCHGIEIGDHESLPWKGGTWGAEAGATPDGVVARTLDLLRADQPTLVRMETLRRATIYLARVEGGHGYMRSDARETAPATRLREALDARAAAAAPGTQALALALFDAGYLAECYAQAGAGRRGDGLERIRQAIALRRDDGAMELAAALACMHPERPGMQAHLARAVDLAPDGTLLARAIEAQCRFWDWPPLPELRRAGTARATR